MKKSLYKDQIEQILKGIKIVSLNAFLINNKEEVINNQTPYSNFYGELNAFGSNTNVDESKKKEALIQALTNAIYSQFYCGITGGDISQNLPSKESREEFMKHLSEANTTKNGFDYNWEIYQVDASGNAFAKKNDELRWLQPNGYHFQNPNQKQAAVNTKVNLIKTNESKSTQPVFYHVFSNEMFPQEVEICRFYWNVKPDGAAKLITLVTKTLNDYKIPFQYKCLNHPDLYVRTDSAVLYVDKKHVQVVSIILKSIIKEISTYLKDVIPMFTHQIFKGVGYAEDPGKGMSFGMSRSSVIAEALVNSFLKKENDKKRLNSVINFLDNKGLSIQRLHLNKHTQSIINFPSYA